MQPLIEWIRVTKSKKTRYARMARQAFHVDPYKDNIIAYRAAYMTKEHIRYD